MKHPICDPLLGLFIEEALGLNTHELLAAATDKFAGLINVKSLVVRVCWKKDGQDLRAREGLFHTDGGEKADEQEGTNGEWCDICTGTTEERERALSKLLRKSDLMEWQKWESTLYKTLCRNITEACACAIIKTFLQICDLWK